MFVPKIRLISVVPSDKVTSKLILARRLFGRYGNMCYYDNTLTSSTSSVWSVDRILFVILCPFIK